MRNFFLKTLYQKRLLLLWWFVGITFVTFVTVSVYESFKATDFEQVLKGLPPALQNLAGDASTFKTVDGYLVQQVYSLRLPLLLMILSISLLVALTAGDEQKGLLETQLSLPVSRKRLLLQKLGAGTIIIILASFGSLLGIIFGLGILLDETLNLGNILQYTLNCVAVSLVYGLIAFTIAAVTGRRSLALGLGSGFAFISYLINSMAPSVSFFESIDKLTFFHYYQNDPFELRNFALLVVVALILVAVSVIGFNRRDIRTN